MNNQKSILNIDVFLDIVDPEKTINREDAIKQITLIIFAKSIAEMGIKMEPDAAIKHLKRVNRFDEFTKILDKVTIEIRNDYIKTHLKAMNEEKRSSLISEYPSLKMLIE